MKDSEQSDRADDRRTMRTGPSTGWKSMPDGSAKLAAYLEQAHERARRKRIRDSTPPAAKG
jgi:hypothetical protein